MSNWDDTFKGYATYTGSGYVGGAALLDPIPADMKITALNPFQYNFKGVKAAMAGAYLRVRGPKGQTIVYVTDLYPEGASGALDLSPNAFREIGNMADGKIDIQWKVIEAPISRNLKYRIKEGSSQCWAAIQIRNHKFPIVKLEYSKGGQWINLEKMNYNHFVGTDFGNQPLHIRITDIRGVQVVDTISALPDHVEAVLSVADPVAIVTAVADPLVSIMFVADPVAIVTSVADPVAIVTSVADPVAIVTSVADPVAIVTSVADPVAIVTSVADPVAIVTSVADPVAIVTSVADPVAIVTSVADPVAIVTSVADPVAIVTSVADPVAIVTSVADPVAIVTSVADPVVNVTTVV
ncbi:hypothetical protein I4U23_022448 [Adineta vaga]|nr:hypothetical protein I4U23_022448 [Adineta vaga]